MLLVSSILPSIPCSMTVGFALVNPLSFILLCLAGWISREQRDTIDYLQEEIKVLKEILGKKPRFTDRKPRRLAVKAKKIRFRCLKDIANLTTCDRGRDSPEACGANLIIRPHFRQLSGNKSLAFLPVHSDIQSARPLQILSGSTARFRRLDDCGVHCRTSCISRC